MPLAVGSNSPSTSFHVTNLGTLLLRIPDHDVLQVSRLYFYAASGPKDFVPPAGILVDRIGEFLHVNGWSGLHFRSRSELFRRLGLVVVVFALKRCD